VGDPILIEGDAAHRVEVGWKIGGIDERQHADQTHEHAGAFTADEEFIALSRNALCCDGRMWL
jgi:hypothetical protein